MEALCKGYGDVCPAGLRSCSKIHELSEDGDKCRKWFADLPSDNERDAIAENICFRIDTDDCRCINRTLTKEYMDLKRNNPINDKCWFTPCANPSKYFVPIDLKRGGCPENLCEIIFNIYNDRDVKVYQNDLVCNMSGGDDVTRWLKMHWPVVAMFVLAYVIYKIARA